MQIKDFLAKYLTVGKMEDGDVGYSVPWSLYADTESERYFLSSSSSVSEKHIGGTTTTMIIARIKGELYADVSGSDLSLMRKITEHRVDVKSVKRVFRSRERFVSFLRENKSEQKDFYE